MNKYIFDHIEENDMPEEDGVEVLLYTGTIENIGYTFKNYDNYGWCFSPQSIIVKTMNQDDCTYDEENNILKGVTTKVYQFINEQEYDTAWKDFNEEFFFLTEILFKNTYGFKEGTVINNCLVIGTNIWDIPNFHTSNSYKLPEIFDAMKIAIFLNKKENANKIFILLQPIIV